MLLEGLSNDSEAQLVVILSASFGTLRINYTKNLIDSSTYALEILRPPAVDSE